MSTPGLVSEWKEMLLEQLEYRELLKQMTLRDLMLRYKQTIMGVGWAVFMPLVNTAVFSVIFMRVTTLKTPVAYPVFAYCGLWSWNFFAASIRMSLTSLTSNSNLVTKIYFPREILPVSGTLVCLADFAVGAVVLAGLMIWYHVPLTAHVIWLPAVLGVELMFTIAVTLILSMANLFFRDVKYLFEVVVVVWMFSTSVLFPIDEVTGKLGFVLRLNPMTTIIDSYRSVLLLGHAPSWGLAIVAAGAAALLAGAWLVFHRLEFRFAEAI